MNNPSGSLVYAKDAFKNYLLEKNVVFAILLFMFVFPNGYLAIRDGGGPCNELRAISECDPGVVPTHVTVNISAPAGLTYSVGGTSYSGNQTNICLAGPFIIDINNNPLVQVIYVSGTGTLSVTRIICLTGGCSGVSECADNTSLSKTFPAGSAPAANFNYVSCAGNEACQPSSNCICLYAAPLGYTSVFTSVPVGLSINSASGEVNINGSTPGVYTVTHTLSNACGASFEDQTFTVHESLTANAGANFTACGASSSLNGVMPSTGGGVWTKVSGPAGGNISTPTSSTSAITSLVPGVYVYEWTVTNLCGSDADQVSVTVSSSPSMPGAISGSNTVCSGSSQSYSISSVSGATSYSWSYSGGGTASSSTTSVTFNPTTSGTLSVTATNLCGISASSDLVISVTPLSTAPTIGIGVLPIPFCSGQCVPRSISGGTLESGGTWNWYAGGCGSGSPVATGTSVNLCPTVTTTYYVRGEGACGDGPCTSFTLTVDNGAGYDASFSYSGSPWCTTDADPTPTITGDAGGSFSRSPAGLSINSSTGAIDLSASSPGTYTVTYNVGDFSSCALSTETVVVVQGPTVAAAGSNQNVCNSPGTTNLAGNTATNGTGVWTKVSGPAGGAISTPGSPTSGLTGLTNVGTYVYQWAITNGCGSTQDQVSIIVGIVPVIPGAITGASPICPSTSQTYSISAVAGATSYTWNYTGGGTASSTSTSVTLTPTSSGTLSVTANNSCGSSTAQTIPIVTSIVSVAPTSISGTTTICGGNTILTAVGGAVGTGATIQWYSGSCGGAPVGAGASITISPIVNTTYFVRYEGTCNTTACASVTVTVNSASVTPSSITGVTNICNGGSTTLTVSGGALGTGATVEWYSGSCGGASVGSGNSITVSPAATLSYFVRYEGTCNTTGCASASVVVTPAEDASFTLSSALECQNGTDVAANITGTAGGGFTATPVGLSINASTGAIDVSASTANAYVVTYTTVGTCPAMTTQNITITQADDATFALSSMSECQNGTDINATITGIAGGAFTSTPAGLSLNAATGAIDVSGSTIGLYDVTYTTSGTCPETLTLNVTISTSDDATFSYSGSTYCLTGTDPTPTITGLAGGGFTSTPSGLILNATTGEVTLLTSALNTYDVTYTTVGPCPESMTVQVTITTSPSAGFSYAASPYCEGSGVAAVTFDPGASAGVFSSTVGLVINASTGEIDLNASTAGTYTVDNNIAAGGGCAAATANTSVTITVQDDPSYSYGATSFCENDVNPVPTITGTTGGAFTSAPAGLTINATTGEIDITTSTLGTAFTVTYTTNGTCPDSQDAVITLNSSPTAPTVSTTSTTNTICVGGSIDILASGSGAGVTYNVYDALTGGTLLGTAPLTVTPTTDTDYYVEVTNANSCSQVGGRDLISVTVNPLPSIDAGTDETICPGDDVTLTATGVGTYSWSTTETTPSVLVSPATTTTYTVTLTDANTCTNSDDVLVTVQSIGGSLVAVDDVFNADVATATNSDVLSNDTHSGTTPNVIGGPNSGTAIVETDGTITYTGNAGFEGTDVFIYTICDAFCTSICDTAEVTVTVKTEVDISIPGGFSPNGDGINDGFVIVGLDNFPNNSLQIFNRWGSLIYQADPYNNDWDGSSSESGVLIGGELPVGTYFYILDLGNDSSPIKGSFELKRN